MTLYSDNAKRTYRDIIGYLIGDGSRMEYAGLMFLNNFNWKTIVNSQFPETSMPHF